MPNYNIPTIVRKGQDTIVRKHINHDEFEKHYKEKLEDADNMFNWTRANKIYNDDYGKFSTIYRSHIDLFNSGYTYNDLKELSSYPILSRYTGFGDREKMKKRFFVDVDTETVEEKKDSKQIKREEKQNPYITREKDRIKKQKESKDYTRSDHFAIGTVYLNIPPTQISISDEKHNFRYNSLRSKGETILSSGRSTTRIDLDIFFTGLDDINNKLRPLLAQFKTIPFLPIENEYLKAILNPFNKELFSSSIIQSKEEQHKELEKRAKKVKKLAKYAANKNEYDMEIANTLRKMHDDGWISHTTHTKFAGSYFIDPNTIPKEELFPEDYIKNEDGSKTIDVINVLKRNMTVDLSDGDFVGMEKNLTELKKLQKEIDNLKTKSSRLGKEALAERFNDKQIVGVLSQFSISTVPDFPETLACRISLFVFDYSPFSEDFAFISGYNRNAWTPDITKCDLFIDWYTKRFLSDKNDPLKPGLSEIEGDNRTIIEYITHLNPIDEETVDPETLRTETLELNDGLIVTGITVSFRNIIQFLPILSHQNPTCQYMGSFNTDIQINMESTSLGKVNEVSKMVERIGVVSRDNNKIARNNFMYINNEMLRLCGLKFFIVNSFNVDTVPQNPGTYSLSLTLSEYKLGTERIQKLRRKGITNKEEIDYTAKFMLDKAYLFATTGGMGGPNAEYRKYYNDVSDWLFDDGRDIVTNFLLNEGVFGGNVYNKLRMDLNGELSKKTKVEWLSDAAESFIYINRPVAKPRQIEKDKIKEFLDELKVSLEGGDKGKGKKSLFETKIGLISRVITATRDSDIKERIFDSSKNPKLHGELEKQRKKGTTKSYCYPDMELPKYMDIPDDVKNKDDVDSGEVDPDFFFYKGSLWGDLAETGLNGYVEMAISTFKNLVSSNNIYRLKEPLSEDDMALRLMESPNDPQEGVGGYGKPLLSDERKELEGKDVEVLEVIDGDTAKVITSWGEEKNVRLFGFNAPEKNTTRGPLATAALRKILPKGIKMQLLLGNGIRDKDDKLLIHGTVMQDGKRINISHAMITQEKVLGLRRYFDPNDPLAISDENAFFKSHEAYIIANALKKRSPTVRVLNKLKDKTSLQSLTGGGYRAGYTIGRWLTEMWSGEPEDVEPRAENAIGVLLEGFVTGDKEKGYKIEDNIFTNLFLNRPENRFGLNRFDRESNERIEIISRKIRESQKDDDLRVSRAFPTFKLYFIEEDMPEWGLLDDLYEYGAVQSIDIIKSRKEPADTAIIKILNTKGTLDTTKFGNYDKDGKYEPDPPEEKIKKEFQETELEQEVENFILKPGTRIQIKIGYSADPDKLDIVFNGMVAEVDAGDMMTVVAQGYGIELLNTIEKSSYRVWSAAAFKLLDKLISRPEVLHFGKYEYFPDRGNHRKNMGRRPVRDPITKEWKEPSWWRNIDGIRHLIQFRDDPRDNNIYYPEQSFLYNLFHGGKQSIVTKGQTIWDVFQNMALRMPGYIAAVLPFDQRATMFFGPADFYYHHTAEKKAEVREWERNFDASLMMELDKDKIIKELEKTEGKITIIKNDVDGKSRLNTAINKINSTLTKIYKESDWYKKAQLERITYDNPFISEDTNRERLVREIESYLLVPLKDTDHDYDNKKRAINSFLSIVKDRSIKDFIPRIDSVNRIFYLEKVDDKGEYFITENGSLMTGEDMVDRYNMARNMSHPESNPSRKAVRVYHFKDSFHHIVANNIIASNRYMYNKVSVEWGNEFLWQSKKLIKHSAGFQTVSCQADDDIWIEKIKEKKVTERNARNIITAWMYGLGHLWQGMRDMYTGHLTILGDPSIKPYDFVFLSDYYTDMFGPVEVEQVVHHFSPETGYITTITPDLACYVNNIMQQGLTLVAGAHYDRLGERLMAIRSAVGPLDGWPLGSIASKITFNLSAFAKDRREPICFTPLLYAGRPYLAGVEGMRKNTLWEAVKGRVYKAVREREKVVEYTTEVYKIAVEKWMNRKR